MATEQASKETILMTNINEENNQTNLIQVEQTELTDDHKDIHETNSKSSFEQIKAVLKFKKYKPILPLICFYISAGYMPTVFITAYGAEWFAKQNCTDDECPFDYTSWTLYASLFLSLRGLISFLFASYIGRLSDAYGRKPFLYMHVLTSMLPVISLLCWYNMWPYFVLYLFGGLNGSNNSATPIMISYVADIIPSQHRTISFGMLYIMGGFGLFVGSISAIIISIKWSDYINFIVVTLLYIFQLLYLKLFMQESLAPSNRKPIGKFNPFAPLFHIKDHPVVYYCCIVSFLISLPETGVLDTAIPYMLDQLQINDNKTMANIITGIFILLVGFGMILSNVFLLPCLKKTYSDYEIALIGAVIVSISMLLFAAISWIPSIVTICITAMVLSMGFIVFPSIYSIATKYLSPKEQGMGMGIIFACRGLTYAIAPFSFGYAYTLFKSLGFPSFPYIVAMFICLIAVFVIKFRLKQVIDIVDLSPDSYCLSMTDLTSMQQMEILRKRNNALSIYKSHKGEKVYHKISSRGSSADDDENNNNNNNNNDTQESVPVAGT